MTTVKRRWVPIVGGAVTLVVLLGIAGAALSFAWLRLKSGPIQLGGSVSGMDDHGVRLTADEIARMGPGVILDLTTPAGERVLLSAQ